MNLKNATFEERDNEEIVKIAIQNEWIFFTICI